MKNVSQCRDLAMRFVAEGDPSKVFPLLCPIREYDWIPIWKCRMIYSQSGMAEKGCVFRTWLPQRGRETWNCFLYEPHQKIGYLRMGGGKVIRLEISLSPEQEATSVHWATTYTGMGRWGNRYIEKMTPERYENEVGGIAAMLNHYMKTGTSLTKTDLKRMLQKSL